jgi:hypothetical protein
MAGCTRTLVLLVVAAAVTSCRPNGNDPLVLPPELIIEKGAADVRTQKRADGGVELSYRAVEQFPAESLLSELKGALPTERWRPLTENWLNPGLPSGNSRGWTSFADGTKKPPKLVHVWSAAWQDSQGNLVEYSVTYESRERPVENWSAPPDDSTAIVTASWLPAAAVEELRRAAGATGPPK